jgi:hypothetical protein
MTLPLPLAAILTWSLAKFSQVSLRLTLHSLYFQGTHRFYRSFLDFVRHFQVFPDHVGPHRPDGPKQPAIQNVLVSKVDIDTPSRSGIAHYAKDRADIDDVIQKLDYPVLLGTYDQGRRLIIERRSHQSW